MKFIRSLFRYAPHADNAGNPAEWSEEVTAYEGGRVHRCLGDGVEACPFWAAGRLRSRWLAGWHGYEEAA